MNKPSTTSSSSADTSSIPSITQIVPSTPPRTLPGHPFPSDDLTPPASLPPSSAPSTIPIIKNANGKRTHSRTDLDLMESPSGPAGPSAAAPPAATAQTGTKRAHPGAKGGGSASDLHPVRPNLSNIALEGKTQVHKPSGYRWAEGAHEEAPGYGWTNEKAAEEVARAIDAIVDQDVMINGLYGDPLLVRRRREKQQQKQQQQTG